MTEGQCVLPVLPQMPSPPENPSSWTAAEIRGKGTEKGKLAMGEFRFNPEEILADEIIIDKFEAAKLQINSAIKIFFYDWDAVSMYTLTGAAHQILHDISKKEGKNISVKDSPLVQGEDRKHLIRAFNFPQNFFKHADIDHKNTFKFKYRATPLYLFDTIRMYILLADKKPSHEMKIFLMWSQLRFPDLFNFPALEEDLGKIRSNIKDPDEFRLLGRSLLEESEKDSGKDNE